MSGISDTDLRLSRIGQIAMRVHNLEKSIEFYRDKLGLQFLFQAPPGLAFFDCDGVRLMLNVPEPGNNGSDHPGSIIYFKVEDIQSAHETLSDRDVEFINKPHLIAKMPDYHLWMAFFHDPDDNTLALMSELRIQ